MDSEEKIAYLTKAHNIPRSRILSSLDLTFQRDILEATSGRGVDVILNSLSGELLRASWKCVAEFGCLVDIGERDVIEKETWSLGSLEANRSYFRVDLTRVCSERPWIASK